jgi:hypothetical protein
MWDWIEEQYPAPGSRAGANGFPPLSASDAAALARAVKPLYGRDKGWLAQMSEDWLQSNSPLPRGGYPAWPSPSNPVLPMSAPASSALFGEPAATGEPSASQAARGAAAATLAGAARHPYGRRLFASAGAPDGQPDIAGMRQAEETRQSESSEGNDHHHLPHLSEREAVERPPGGGDASLLEPWDRDPPPAARYWRPNQGEMRSYEPPLRDRFRYMLQEFFAKGMSRLEAQHYAEGLTGIAGMTPFGIPFAVNDMKRAADRGSPLGVVTSAIGTLPPGRIVGRLAMDAPSRIARAKEMGFRTDMPLRFAAVPAGEGIAEAAIKLKDGRVFTGTNHGEAAMEAERYLGKWPESSDLAPIGDGFMTTAGRYVSRREAEDIAGRSGQGSTGGIFGATRGLASEDVAAASGRPSPRIRTGGTAPGLPGGAGVWGYYDPATRHAPAAPGTIELWHRADRPVSVDVAGAQEGNILATLSHAWEQGHDAVLLRNYTTPAGEIRDILVVKDPAQLRDPKARFDPKKRDSANLKASFGGAGLIGLGAGANQGAQRNDEP